LEYQEDIMIVTVGGIKGGSGKTTVATNLAVIRSQAGRDVLLIDADDQETSSDFTVLRNEQMEDGAGYTSIKLTGGAVRTETLRLKEKYQDIIIDTGGRDTTSQRAAVSVSDVLLVPFVPRSFDVWTIEKVAALVDEMQAANPGIRAYTFLNRADPRGSDNEGAADVLKESNLLRFVNTPIGARKAFSNAAAEGLAVTELRQQDPKAIEEIMVLYRYVFDTRSVSS
jgi:chromosome partitioning protein